MKYLFDARELRSLGEFLRANTLIALDYDGTLAPIAPNPEQAVMRDATRALLARVARRYPVIVLTGRSRIDALRFLVGVPVLEVIGSHGGEMPGAPVTGFLRRVAAWRVQLVQGLRALTGVQIEDKKYSLAVHYRHSEDPVAARDVIREAAAGLEGARIIGGKKVVNVVPREAPDKGAALLAACSRLGCERALFVGDDATDETAFAAASPKRVFTVRVGQSPTSKAAHFLRSQRQMDDLLQALLEARAH